MQQAVRLVGLVVVCVPLYIGICWAGEPLPVVGYRVNRQLVCLTFQHGVAVYADASGQLTVSQLLAKPGHYSFQYSDSPIPVAGSTPHWLRITVENTDAHSLPILLEIDHPFLNRLDTYLVVNNRVVDSLPTLSQRVIPADRPFEHRNFVLPLQLPAHQHSQLYLRLLKGPGTHAFPLRLWQPAAFQQHDITETVFWGGLVGWLTFGIVLSLFLFVTVRDWVYLLYSFYSLAHLLTLLVNEGLGATYYAAGLPLLAEPYVGDVAIGLITGSNMLFVRSLLSSRDYVPRWLYGLSQWGLWVWGAWLLGCVVDSCQAVYLPVSFRVIAPDPVLDWLKYVLNQMSAFMAMLLIIFGLRQPTYRRLAWTYLLAYMPIVAVAGLYYYGNFWSLPLRNMAQTQTYGVAVIFETGTLLFGLAYRFKLYRDERERALLEQRNVALQTLQSERARLARELHDYIGPDLAGLKMQMEGDQERMPVLPQQQLGRYISSVSRILTDVRQVSHALLPTDLQETNLITGLTRFIDTLSAIPGNPEISFVYDLKDEPPSFLKQFVFQITKELILNAIKHAKATLVDVDLYSHDHILHLTVADDGQEYNPTDISTSEGIGLRNLQAVVELLKGQLVINSKKQQGMVHQIILPVG